MIRCDISMKVPDPLTAERMTIPAISSTRTTRYIRPANRAYDRCELSTRRSCTLVSPMGETRVQERLVDSSQRSYARFAGLMYLVVLVLDIAGIVILSAVRGSGTFIEISHRIIASETIYRVGLSLALAGSMATILLAVSLYATLKPVDGNLTMMALLFRASEGAIGGVGIVIAFSVLQIQLAANHANAFDTNQLTALANFSSGPSTDVSAIFFTAGSTIFFYVFLKSGYIPRILSAWGIFASL